MPSRFWQQQWGAAVCATLLFFGCGRPPSPTSNTGAAAPVLRVAHPDQPRRLDPAFVKDLYEGICSGWIYDGLVGYGAGPEIEPRLAESWEVLEGGSLYRFRLRPGATFHDGRPVRAADVRYSFERVLHPATGSDRRWVLDRIAGAAEFTSGTSPNVRGIITPDDQTVEIRLTAPAPVFLTLLAMPTGSIIPDGSAGALGTKPSGDFDRHPIGTGPWKLTDWQRDRRLTFVRNETFWGRAPAATRLTYDVIADDASRRTLFEAGGLDIVELGFQEWDAWQADASKRNRIRAVQELRTDFIGLGCDRPALQDPRVRAAIASAINTEAIFRQIQKGRGTLATGLVPDSARPWPARSAPRQDVARARALLAEAGYGTTQSLTLDFWYREQALNGEIVQAVKADLQAVGISVQTFARDQAAFREAIYGGKPDLFLGSWTLDYPDPENALYPPFHSRNIPRQGNQAHLRLAALDSALDAARREPDSSRRTALLQQAENLAFNAHPWIPLFHRQTNYGIGLKIQSWTPRLVYNAERYLDLTFVP